MINNILNWINYWLVEEDATEKQRLSRIREVGCGIGMAICTLCFIIYAILKSERII